nr:class I SAM-dependent methyltransferase [Pseudanabaena sp. PCC 7367]
MKPEYMTYGEMAETQRRNWYSEAAAAYDRARPRYPRSICDRAVQLANLSKGDRIVEIGCGPAIATPTFAEMGLKITAIEPSKGQWAIARQKCEPYDQVEVINNTFESWQAEAIEKEERFDAVLATTSFHWLSPDTRCEKIASLLPQHGSLILLWNTPPVPSYQIYQKMEPVYQAIAPHLANYADGDSHQENLDEIAQSAIDSGYFGNLQTAQMMLELDYSIDDYLALLSTLSPYIGLEQEQCDRLFTALRQVLEKGVGNTFPTSFLSALHVMQKL